MPFSTIILSYHILASVLKLSEVLYVMGFGNHGASWVVCLAGTILFLTKLISCCESSGTNFSKGLEACVKLLGCTDVRQEDIRPCFKNCLATGKYDSYLFNRPSLVSWTSKFSCAQTNLMLMI